MALDKEEKRKARSPGLDPDDWKRIKELVLMAGAAAQRKDLEQFQTSDAMAFSTLGLAILDLHERLTTTWQLMDSVTLASNQPPKSRIVVES